MYKRYTRALYKLWNQKETQMNTFEWYNNLRLKQNTRQVRSTRSSDLSEVKRRSSERSVAFDILLEQVEQRGKIEPRSSEHQV